MLELRRRRPRRRAAPRPVRPRRRVHTSPDDPYPALGVDAYSLARAADAASLAPEIALLRRHLRHVANQIHAPGVTLSRIIYLQRESCRLIGALTRAVAVQARLARRAAPPEAAFDAFI